MARCYPKLPDIVLNNQRKFACQRRVSICGERVPATGGAPAIDRAVALNLSEPQARRLIASNVQGRVSCRNSDIW